MDSNLQNIGLTWAQVELALFCLLSLLTVALSFATGTIRERNKIRAESNFVGVWVGSLLVTWGLATWCGSLIVEQLMPSNAGPAAWACILIVVGLFAEISYILGENWESAR